GRYLFIIFSAIALISIISLLSGVFKAGKNLINNPDVRVEKTTLYRNLFKESVQDSLRSDNTVFYDYREPYSVFTYRDGGNKFKIIIWKYATKSIDEPLSVTLTETRNALAVGQVYRDIKAGYYDVWMTQ